MEWKKALKKILLFLFIVDLILIMFLPFILNTIMISGPALWYNCDLDFSNYCKTVTNNPGNWVLTINCLCSGARTQLVYIGVVLLVLLILAHKLPDQTKKINKKSKDKRENISKENILS
ncbi:MAG: hypothetical protein AABX38_04855 [Candidatus Micrarchaeota archaeon]